MKALITRAPLSQASYSTYLEHYYSPSNSSLLIHAPEDEIHCSKTLDGSNYNLPVLFSVTGQTTASITVQVRFMYRCRHIGVMQVNLWYFLAKNKLDRIPLSKQRNNIARLYCISGQIFYRVLPYLVKLESPAVSSLWP